MMVPQPAPVEVPYVLPAGSGVPPAVRPPTVRDDVRLLVSRRHRGTVSSHFTRLAEWLSPGDLVVINDSATLPAALDVGNGVSVHLSTSLSGYRGWWRSGEWRWVVEPRRWDGRREFGFPDGAELRLLHPYGRSSRLWEGVLTVPVPFLEWLARWGRPIRYDYMQAEPCIEQYQTLFATRPGSAEMPSAGRPFTPRVTDALGRRGVGLATITLHTGVASQELHEPPYPEVYEVPAETAAAVYRTHRSGGRVIAVGTTVVRAIESAPAGGGGWTDQIITPARGVSVVDGLLTGLHDPKASHLAMLAAVLPAAELASAYRMALQEGYRWHEFGDMHLIL